MKIQIFVRVVFFSFFLFRPLLSNEFNLQIGMEIWDKTLALDDGFYEGLLIKQKGSLILTQAKVKIWKQKENFLLVGLDEQGEEKWKLLKHDKTNRSYFTKLPSFRIQLISSYSEIEIIPEFNFSFVDLLWYKVEERFLPKTLTEYQTKTNTYHKIELEPLRESEYQKIFIYLSKENLSPYRMDVFLTNGEFQKIIQVEVNEKEKYFKRISVTNTNTSEKSILELKVYKPLQVSKTLFELYNFSNKKESVYP
ncbi:MAG: outer membrane lipoprotein-sorting protein [Leptospiraceae bacterium]|nr:outer membrane lipoprotein-sorting protein [Leptospiraceae bacterium]